MSKTMTARDMAKLSSLFSQAGIKASFKVLFQGKVRVLSDLRPAVTAKGNPSTRTIHLKQDGKAANFDGRYEFQLTQPAEQAVSFRKSK